MEQNDDLHIRVQSNPLLGVPLLIVIAVFALCCFAVFVIKISSLDLGEAAVYLLIGLGLTYVGLRVAAYFFKPSFSVTAQSVVMQRFWGGATTWDYAQTRAWRTETQYIDRNAKGRKLRVPFTVERLFRTDSAGSETKTTLPNFYPGNEIILTAIEARSRMPVVRATEAARSP